jgi:hypothetical protein
MKFILFDILTAPSKLSPGFIQCISDAQENVVGVQAGSLMDGIDTFYLIFAVSRTTDNSCCVQIENEINLIEIRHVSFYRVLSCTLCKLVSLCFVLDLSAQRTSRT